MAGTHNARRHARREAESAGFWGRQTLGNINLGLDAEAVRFAATAAAHHYHRRQLYLELAGQEEAHHDAQRTAVV